MSFNWKGAWKVYSQTITSPTTIGLSDTPTKRSLFVIKNKPNPPEWTLLGVKRLGWLPGPPNEFTLTPDNAADPTQFTTKVKILETSGDEEEHDVLIEKIPASDEVDDELLIKVDQVSGGIGKGTGNAGRG